MKPPRVPVSGPPRTGLPRLEAAVPAQAAATTTKMSLRDRTTLATVSAAVSVHAVGGLAYDERGAAGTGRLEPPDHPRLAPRLARRGAHRAAPGADPPRRRHPAHRSPPGDAPGFL